MRHVIVGAQTPVGSSIIRLLTSINIDNIVAVSPSGQLPDGVDPKKVDAKFGDVIDVYTLLELFEEGDIIYNCQILWDELSPPGDAELYNNIGLVNLLGVASLVSVEKIVIAFPQALGYELPDSVTEKEWGQKASPIQKTLREAIEIIYNYWDEVPFGWNRSKIADFATQVDQTLSEEDEDLEEPPTSDAPSGPSLGPKSTDGDDSSGPSLGPQQQQLEQDDGVDQSSSDSAGSNQDDDDKSNESDEIEEIEFDRVPVIIARIAKLFGPFDPELTEKYCRAIRLQRLTVIGEIDQPITWINPIDAGRAMIVLGDPNLDVENEEYLLNGFVASPKEILIELDRVNHSSLNLETKSLLPIKVSHYFKSILRIFGLQPRDEYYYHLQFNKKQVFDDSKAREEVDWEPKYDLKRTVRDALNWFTSHQL